MINARQFLDQIAETLRSQGRPVTVEETQEDWGTFVWLSAPAPAWYQRSMNLSAAKPNRSNRWRLGELRVGPSLNNKGFNRKTRSQIRIAAEVFA